MRDETKSFSNWGFMARFVLSFHEQVLRIFNQSALRLWKKDVILKRCLICLPLSVVVPNVFCYLKIFFMNFHPSLLRLTHLLFPVLLLFSTCIEG